MDLNILFFGAQDIQLGSKMPMLGMILQDKSQTFVKGNVPFVTSSANYPEKLSYHRTFCSLREALYIYCVNK